MPPPKTPAPIDPSRLRAAVDASGWRQGALAAHIDVSPQHMSDVLRGKRNLSHEKLIRFAKAVRCRVADLKFDDLDGAA